MTRIMWIAEMGDCGASAAAASDRAAHVRHSVVRPRGVVEVPDDAAGPPVAGVEHVHAVVRRHLLRLQPVSGGAVCGSADLHVRHGERAELKHGARQLGPVLRALVLGGESGHCVARRGMRPCCSR